MEKPIYRIKPEVIGDEERKIMSEKLRGGGGRLYRLCHHCPSRKWLYR